MGPHSIGPAQAGITIDEVAWRRALPRAEAIVRRALAAVGAEADVVLTDDRTVRRLNARHRGQAKPTNVLTFEGPPGEIYLALGVVRREAGSASKPMARHLAHLVVHGALHLLGHDHATAGEARRMESAEARLLGRLGAGNPWRPREVRS